MCYYLNVHFQGQRVKVFKQHVYDEEMWTKWYQAYPQSKLLYEISDFRRSSVSLFWDVKRRKFDSCDRCFGIIYRSHLQGSGSPSSLLGTAWLMKMGPTGCFEMSVTAIKITSLNIPQNSERLTCFKFLCEWNSDLLLNNIISPNSLRIY